MKHWKTDPKTLIWVGGIAVVLGFVMPLLMVSKVLPSTYFLNFLAFAFQLLGMSTSIIGAFSLVKTRLDVKKADKSFIEEQPSDKHR
ncbi:MAG TPA: hypothetical protein PLH64_08145 [Anaerolineaceae bacterium]|jgi:mannose/fructose/N-acetylgalactosamine-specific phosphotransferase system component IIC|nr:hypothetical protein [Anaerolineaceae bacterium]